MLLITSILHFIKMKLTLKAGINTVEFGGYGYGIQVKTGMKSIVGSIVITDPGSGYKNKERKIVSSGISTMLKIVLKSKNMVTKLEKLSDIRKSDQVISGIVESKDYYVRKIDSDKFSLSEVGVGGTSPKYFFDREIIVDIKSVGEELLTMNPL